ncbi:MAG: hypothetical protein NZ773_01260 [Dehalococcoidia bacterium]|nr:hypothetical protein [Dehalococcoidia bacterium]
MDQHPDRRVVLVLSALLLILSLLLYKLGGYLTDSEARLLDLNWLALTDAGFIPYRDLWVERPPVMAGWSWLAYRASLLLPPWHDWRLFFALFDGLAGLAGGLAALALAGRLLSPIRLAVLGASLGLLASAIASDGPLLLAFVLGWVALEGASHRRAATLLATVSPFAVGPLLLLVHLAWGVLVQRRLLTFLAAAPLLGAVGAAAVARGHAWASAAATIATGGAPLFTATERRLDPALAPTPGGEWLLAIGLVLLAGLAARRMRLGLAEGTALLVAAGGLVGPLAGPEILLILAALALLTLRLVPAALLSAVLGLAGTVWLAAAVGERALPTLLGTASGIAGALVIASRRAAGLTDDGGAAAQGIAFVTLRLGALLLLRPFGYFGEWNDFNFFLGWARLADEGLLPFRDFWMEHPPVFPSLVVVAYQIAQRFPALPEERAWFNLALGLLTFPAEIAALLAARRIAARADAPAGAATASWAYVLSFPALFFWTAGFDGMVLAFTLLGLAAALTGRPGRAGVWTGLGAATKVLPAAVVPALMLAVGRRSAVRLLAAFGATLIVILLPVVAVNPRLALASAASLTTRGSWETVWALADGYYRGGELVPPRARTDPATVAATARPSAVPWLPVAVASAGGYLLLLLRARRPLAPRRALALAAAALLGLLTISKGWSPQFIVYPLGLVFLLLPARRALVYAVTLAAANSLEYPFALLLLDGEAWPLAVAVVWRTAALGALVVELLAIGLPLPPRPRLASAAASALALAPAALLPLIVLALAHYRTLWLEPDDPLWTSLTDTPRSGGLLAASEERFRQLTPYTSVPILRPVAGMLASHALAERPFWRVLGADPPTLERLAVELAPVGVFAALRPGSHSTFFLPVLQPWQPMTAHLGGHALLGSSVTRLEKEDVVPPSVVVSTRWAIGEAGPRDLRLFAHLIGEEGQLLAQSDGPLRPTTPAARERIDRRLIPLARGAVGLLVGLYDGETGERLRAPDGRDAIALPLP